MRLDRLAEPVGHRRVALLPLDSGLVTALGHGALAEVADRALHDARLAERGQHVRDVLDERPVRPDDEHALAAEPLRVRKQEPGRAVEPDCCLARARPALDDQHTVGLVGDQPVLVGLDRLDDVAHPLVAAPLELFEQEVAERAGLVAGGAAERLVGDVEEAPALGPEAAASRDPLRHDGSRRVEGPCRRRLPVDDDDALVVLVNPAPTDVPRVALLHVQTAEADAALGVLVAPKCLRLPFLERERGELA